ncbi:MAG: phenol 2-monooxygenase [Hyphomonas sp. BRH_c22]|uniref:aromatic/alkene/methane monooxygenase hydroxylase/oxygenase subunit alpha n=1 Tax=Hyphomonas sp. BRH_c22 TaxID=1629710 RepID=UPI0005F18D06|nr:aromatic/alkene/methane monooxygenase hydroxylase/oxygenase subunit alpha [Hyphomonas sp. BRH_c22]KJS34780.1 MAG: phenol 2-monooxygenase [Hyphomonas sp. BRH_c22]
MAAKRMNSKKRYELLTRNMGWETTYQSMDEVFPYDKFEGIKIKDWDKWEDPFRLTVDAYWKFQAEKDKKLYAIIDSFAQNNGQMNISDARYVNALKLFIQGVTPLEYYAHRHYAHLGRHFRGEGTRVACQMQSIDELRHAQTQIHTLSHYNKYFDGLHDPFHMFDRVWYLSVPKSYFEDAMTAGPFEFITSVSFSFEYILTNLLFVPFMSGAAYNGDQATVTFGFSAQSDESRHMTLGLEVIKFMVEQHEDNLPIVQGWIDKHFWRAYRVLALVSAMQDYMLPNSPMSWKEAWDVYFVENIGALFDDLSRYGLRMPKYHEVATAESEHLSHQVWLTLYNYSHAAGMQTWVPDDKKLDWLSEKYPNTFDKHYRPRFEMFRQMEADGQRHFSPGLPQLCQVCQVPMAFTEVVAGDAMKISRRVSTYKEDRFYTCSDGCRDVFEGNPAKYAQAWLPVHQIFQGNCGGAELADVAKWCHLQPGDGGEHVGSPDQDRWKKWRGEDTVKPTVMAAE